MVGGLHSRDRHRHQPTKMQMHLVAKKSTRAQECCGAPVSTGFPSLQVQSGSQRSSQIFLLSLPVVTFFFFRGTPWPWRRCPRPPPPPPWSQNVSHERAHGMACFVTALRPDIAPPDLLTAAAAPLLGSWRFNLTFSPPMAFPPN